MSRKSHTHKKAPFLNAILFSCLLLGLFIALLVRETWHHTENDELQYQHLIAEAAAKPQDIAQTPYNATQEREGIRKDLFFTEGCERLHLCLLSDEAQLQVQQVGGRNVLIENLQRVRCFMQEELYYQLDNGKKMSFTSGANQQSFSADELAKAIPLQNIRYLEAAFATYDYDTHRFNANDVEIIHYTAPGHELLLTKPVEPAFLSGKAASVDFTLDGGQLDFKAHQFKARLQSGNNTKGSY